MFPERGAIVTHALRVLRIRASVDIQQATKCGGYSLQPRQRAIRISLQDKITEVLDQLVGRRGKIPVPRDLASDDVSPGAIGRDSRAYMSHARYINADRLGRTKSPSTENAAIVQPEAFGVALDRLAAMAT